MINGIVTPRQIKSLPLTKTERDHRSRTRKGLHVFMSYYMTLFKELGDEEQVEQVLMNNVRSINENADAMSIDSTDTAYQKEHQVEFVEVVRCAFCQWQLMGPYTKEAWEKRAEKLNSRKLPGWLVSIPKELKDSSIVMKLISLEWELLGKVFKEAIERPPSKETLEKNLSYRFGKETVQLRSQTYKSFSMTYLLNHYLFGEDYGKVRNAVVYKSKKITVLHFASQKRVNEVFTVEEKSATQFLYERGLFEAIRTCAGKVQIADKDGKKGVGFILKERHHFWKIKIMGTNNICYLKKLTYNFDENRYEFNDFVDYCGRYITTYWPIRLSVSKAGMCRMTINRVGFEKATGNIIVAHTFTS